MWLSTPEPWLLFLLGAGLGGLGALVGVGGGFLLVPILLYVYPDRSGAEISGLSLLTVFFSATSAAIAHGLARRIDVRSGLELAAAAIPGAIVGGIGVGSVPEASFRRGLGALLVGMAVVLLARRIDPRGSLTGTARTVEDRGGRRYEYRVRRGPAVLSSAVIGVVASLFGIGGGVIQLPLMVTYLGFPVPVAVATAQVVLGSTAAAGVLSRALAGVATPDPARAALLSIGVVLGAQLGVRLAPRVPERVVVLLLAVSVLAAGARLLLAG